MMYSSNAILAQGPCKTLIHIKVKKKKVYTMDKHYRHLNYRCNNEMRHCFVLRCLDLYIFLDELKALSAITDP